jgi:hypothetical protein
MFNQRQPTRNHQPPPGAGKHDQFDLVIVMACTLAAFVSGFAALWSLRLSDGALLVLFGFVGFISAMIGLAHLGYFYGWWHKPVQMQQRRPAPGGSYVQQPHNFLSGAQAHVQGQPRNYVNPDRTIELNKPELAHATLLDQFVRGVVEGGNTAQGYWTKKNWTVQQYTDYINLFIALGIVQNNGQGLRKDLLITDVAQVWTILNNYFNYDVKKSLEMARRMTAMGEEVQVEPLPYRD